MWSNNARRIFVAGGGGKLSHALKAGSYSIRIRIRTPHPQSRNCNTFLKVKTISTFDIWNTVEMCGNCASHVLSRVFLYICHCKNQWTIQIFDNFDKMCDISKVFRILSYFSRKFGQKFQKIYKYPFEGGSVGGSLKKPAKFLIY